MLDTSAQLANIQTEVDLDQYYKPLHKILQLIKGSTATIVNRHLQQSGQVWERESYDILIRNDEQLKNTINYTLENPVKAGLVKNWYDYSGNYWAY